MTSLGLFLKENAGKESTINAAAATNNILGDKKRDKFDVVADQIFKAEQPLPILDIVDWSIVKKRYAKLPSHFSMLLILAYRKRFVDQGISNFCKQYPNIPIITKSVGSTDLTSDYDITVGITGGDISGAELDVIEKFNDRVRVSFGKQPGTIFDTNLYAKDFLALNRDDQRLTIPDVGQAMYNMMVEGQDVGALLKQRRYMGNADWDLFLDSLLSEVGALNSPGLKATQNRYETADAQYLLNLSELLDEFDARATDTKNFGTAAKDYSEAKAKVDAAITESALSPAERTLVRNAANQDMALAQLLLRYKGLMWEHDYPDMVLWATNDLYVKKMRAIRAYQQQLGTQRNLAAGDVRVADLISSAIFFASEAYFSEGALRHVVEGVQVARTNPNLKGDDLAKAINNALMSLTIEQLLQSINEQFGDFLKDFAHYGDTPEIYFRGAKYVQRLFEAADFLSAKKTQGSASEQAALSSLDVTVINTIFPKTVAEILARLNEPKEGLVAVRKGRKTFSGDTNNANRNAYSASEVKTYFGASNGTGLKDRITQMVLKLNAQVRSSLTTTPTLADVQAYFKAVSSNDLRGHPLASRCQ